LASIINLGPVYKTRACYIGCGADKDWRGLFLRHRLLLTAVAAQPESGGLYPRRQRPLFEL